MRISALMFFLPVMLVACSATKQTTNNPKVEKTIWINSYKVDCEGVAPMSCLQYQENEVLQYDGWLNFYQSIEGFEYRPGNIYQLRVRVETLDVATLPADASSLRYQLVEVLQTKPDPTLRLNDIWVLESLLGASYEVKERENRPQMEINIPNRRMGGKAACNNFFGSVVLKSERSISFGAIGSTMMACPNLDKERKMLKAFDSVRIWHIDNNRLVLLDENSREIMIFRKVD